VTKKGTDDPPSAVVTLHEQDVDGLLLEEALPVDRLLLLVFRIIITTIVIIWSTAGVGLLSKPSDGPLLLRLLLLFRSIILVASLREGPSTVASC
jgi:hypothetical protein